MMRKAGNNSDLKRHNNQERRRTCRNRSNGSAPYAVTKPRARNPRNSVPPVGRPDPSSCRSDRRSTTGACTTASAEHGRAGSKPDKKTGVPLLRNAGFFDQERKPVNRESDPDPPAMPRPRRHSAPASHRAERASRPSRPWANWAHRSA